MPEKINITTADVRAELERRKYNRMDYFLSDDVRDGYKKHLEFIEATEAYREICFMAGNRVGKSETVAFCAAVWLTGRYPDW